VITTYKSKNGWEFNMSVNFIQIDEYSHLNKHNTNVYLQHLHNTAISAITAKSSEMLIEVLVKKKTSKYEKPGKFKFVKNIYVPIDMDGLDAIALATQYIQNLLITTGLEQFAEMNAQENVEAIKLLIFNEKTDLYIEYPIMALIVGNWQLNLSKL